MQHEKHETMAESGSGGESLYVPLALVISALILSATLVFVGMDLGGKLNSISTSIGKIQINVQGGTGTGSGTGTGADGTGEPAAKADLDKLADEGPVTGNADAPLTIVVFSDFSCPYCGAASGMSKTIVDYMKQRDSSWVAPIPGILDEYVKSGKARLAFKYFPGHGSGEPAMKVGWCADEQSSDIFWKYHDLAFAVQDQTNDLEKMKALAKQAGADLAKLDACLSSKKYDSRLATDTDAGRSLGVSGTPTFFINGTPMVGAYSFTDVKETLEAELKKA